MNNDGKTQDVVVVLKDHRFPDYKSLKNDFEFITYKSERYKNQNKKYYIKCKSRFNTICYDDLLYKDPLFSVSEEEILEYWKDLKNYTNKSLVKPVYGMYVPACNSYIRCVSKLRSIKRRLFEKNMVDLEKKQKQIRAEMIKIVGEQKYEIRMKNNTYSILMFLRITKDNKEQLSKIEGVLRVEFVKAFEWDKLKEERISQKKSLLEIESKQFNDAREKSFSDEKK